MLYWLGLHFLQQVSLREYVCLVLSAVGCAVGPTSTIASGVLVLAGELAAVSLRSPAWRVHEMTNVETEFEEDSFEDEFEPEEEMEQYK